MHRDGIVTPSDFGKPGEPPDTRPPLLRVDLKSGVLEDNRYLLHMPRKAESEVEEMGAPGRFKDLEPEIFRLLREGVDPTEIAKRLKVPRAAVVYRADRMKKETDEVPRPREEQKAVDREDTPKPVSTLDNLRDTWEDRRNLDRKREATAQSAIDLIDDIEGRFQHDPDLAAEVAAKAVEPIERAYLKLTA